jgi:hypothetical protein
VSWQSGNTLSARVGVVILELVISASKSNLCLRAGAEDNRDVMPFGAKGGYDGKQTSSTNTHNLVSRFLVGYVVF